MGVVYKAEDLKVKRIVALKFLPQHLTRTGEEQARFQQEAQAAQIWKTPFPEGKPEPIPATFPGIGPASAIDIRADGKEIVYIDSPVSAKLVIIEILH